MASYIIPVSCIEQGSTAGLCAKGFSTPLIVLTALISGFGLGVFLKGMQNEIVVESI